MFILGPLSLLLVLQDFLQANRTYRRILTTCGCKAMIYVHTTEEEVDNDDDDDEDKSDDSDDEYIGHLVAKSGEDSDSDDSGSDSQDDGAKSSSSSSSEESSSSSSSSDDSLGKSSVESFGATDRAIIVKYLGHLYKVKLDLAAPIILEDGQKETDYMDPGIEALYGSRLADGSDGRKVYKIVEKGRRGKAGERERTPSPPPVLEKKMGIHLRLFGQPGQAPVAPVAPVAPPRPSFGARLAGGPGAQVVPSGPVTTPAPRPKGGKPVPVHLVSESGVLSCRLVSFLPSTQLSTRILVPTTT